jgi:hypothetical protein
MLSKGVDLVNEVKGVLLKMNDPSFPSGRVFNTRCQLVDYIVLYCHIFVFSEDQCCQLLSLYKKQSSSLLIRLVN